MQFTLSPDLGGLGWQPSEFNNADSNLVRAVHDEAVKRSKERESEAKGKSKTKKAPNIKLPWETN